MDSFIRKTSPRGFLKQVCFSNFRKEKRREKQTVNMPRQYFDIREYEQVSIKIRSYPCFFNISNAAQKEKGRVENLWKEINDYLRIEEGIALCYEKMLPYFMLSFQHKK